MPPKPAVASNIPLHTWLLHRHSRNLFKVSKINVWSVETYDDDMGWEGGKGGANRYLLEQMIRRGTVIVDARGPRV